MLPKWGLERVQAADVGHWAHILQFLYEIGFDASVVEDQVPEERVALVRKDFLQIRRRVPCVTRGIHHESGRQGAAVCDSIFNFVWFISFMSV